MKKGQMLVLVGLLVSGPAAAQVTSCQGLATLAVPGSGNLGAMQYTPPSSHTHVEIIDGDGQPLRPAFRRQITTGQWTVTDAELQAIRRAGASTAKRPLRLIWSGGNNSLNRPCETRLVFDSDADDQPTPDVVPAARQEWSANDCAAAGARWQEEIRAERHKQDQAAGAANSFTQLLFLEGEGVCYANRDYGVEGDPIHVGIFTDEPDLWNGVSATFDPCARESEAPNIRVTGELPGVFSGRQSAVFTIRRYLPRRCFNEAVDITVSSGPGEGQQTARYNLSQAKRYRASYELGVNFTKLHPRSFALRADSTVFDKGPSSTGPDYVAAMVFYSVLKYLPSLAGGDPYLGRDVIHDNDLFDRIGLMLGAGIQHPLDRFVAGVVFEILPGISIGRSYEFAKIDALDGVKTGDKFSGAADALPIQAVWRRGWTMGIAVDLRYVARLFK